MAEQLKVDLVEEGGAGRPPTYDWDQWTNGKTWKVKKDEDFTCTVVSFITLLHYQARKREMKVTTRRVEGEQLEFQFYTPEA